MFTGYYTIASGLMANQKNIETISNNLANIRTPGYRSEKIVNSAFEQELMSRIDSSGITVLGDGIGATVAIVGDSLTRFDTGLIENTGRKLDVAINGQGFFSVQGTDGVNYLTRNGSLDIDAEGYLVLPGVGRVMGQNGPISVKTSDIIIKPDGTITDAKGTSLGKLLISSTDDNTVLKRAKNGLFTTTAQLNQSTNYQIAQGNLELSNVDMNVELTGLVAAQRSLQSCASALKMLDSLDRKAATQIAAI